MAGKKVRNRVDISVKEGLRYWQRDERDGQGAGESEGRTICEDAWSEFILVAQYLFRQNREAEIADVFEFLRVKDMGGLEYSASLMKRVTREVVTECGPF